MCFYNTKIWPSLTPKTLTPSLFSLPTTLSPPLRVSQVLGGFKHSNPLETFYRLHRGNPRHWGCRLNFNGKEVILKTLLKKTRWWIISDHSRTWTPYNSWWNHTSTWRRRVSLYFYWYIPSLRESSQTSFFLFTTRNPHTLGREF